MPPRPCVNFSLHIRGASSDAHVCEDKKGKLGIAKLPRGQCVFPQFCARSNRGGVELRSAAKVGRGAVCSHPNARRAGTVE